MMSGKGLNLFDESTADVYVYAIRKNSVPLLLEGKIHTWHQNKFTKDAN